RHTDAELRGAMTKARDLRRRLGDRAIVTCTVDGYDDPRELGEIPEARHLCQRLFDLGVVTELEASVTVNPPVDDPAVRGMHMGMGALEVWLIARGHFGAAGQTDIPVTVFPQFEADLRAANAANARTIGRVNDHN